MPRAVLAAIVQHNGACMWPSSADEQPPGHDRSLTDAELAEQLCAGCPVQDECLELELRTAGEHTLGVWGALPQDDRRALYPHWLRRGERAKDTDITEGGEA